MKLRDSGMPDEQYWESLFNVGLIVSASSASMRAVPNRVATGRSTLGPFIQAYIATRSDIKPNTKAHLERARRNGDGKPLADITAGDADEFRLYLLTTMADNTFI